MKFVLTAAALLICVSANASDSFNEFETDWDHVPAAKIDRREQTPEDKPIPVNPFAGATFQPKVSTTPDLKIDIFKKPRGLSIPREFMIVRMGDEVKSAHVISTATDSLVEGKPKNTPAGSYLGNIETAKVRTSATGKKSWRVETSPGFEKFVGTLLSFPWHESATYPKPNGGAPMYWAVHIGGGYWIHATPHYPELGRPASMGCVRTTYPSAMELFDYAANWAEQIQITIHESGSDQAKIAFQGFGVSAQWVRDQVESDLADARAISAKHDYTGIAHSRRGKPIVIPNCGSENCLEAYGKVARQ